MTKTLINIKADVAVKRKAQRKAKELGVPLSTIMNAYLKEFVRESSVTFSLSEPQLRPEIERVLQNAARNYELGRNMSGPFYTAEEVDAYLDAP